MHWETNKDFFKKLLTLNQAFLTMKYKIIIFIFFSLLLLFSCTSKKKVENSGSYEVFGKKYTPVASAKNFSQKGIASWYGKKFHGRKTANGEIYDMYTMTCAHKTLPFGTKLEVTNLSNGKKVIVRINDRGPFVKKRIIDLSCLAAQKLGMDVTGTAKVKIRTVGWVDTKKSEKYTVQIGAFSSYENAKKLKENLSEKFKWVSIKKSEKNEKIFYKVRAGIFKDLQKAQKKEKELKKLGFSKAFATLIN